MKSHTIIFELAGLRSHSWNVENLVFSNPYITFFLPANPEPAWETTGHGRALYPTNTSTFTQWPNTKDTNCLLWHKHQTTHMCLAAKTHFEVLVSQRGAQGSSFWSGSASSHTNSYISSPCHLLAVSTTAFLQMKYGLGNWLEIKIT